MPIVYLVNEIDGCGLVLLKTPESAGEFITEELRSEDAKDGLTVTVAEMSQEQIEALPEWGGF